MGGGIGMIWLFEKDELWAVGMVILVVSVWGYCIWRY